MSLVVATGLFLAPALLAQTPVMDGASVGMYLTGGVSGDLHTGELTADGIRDMACLTDGKLVIYHDPAMLDFPIEPPAPSSIDSLSAMTIQRGMGPEGSDRVVVSCAAGLAVCTLDPFNVVFDWVLLPSTVSAAGSASLLMQDLGGAGIDDLLAISADRSQFTVWQPDGEGGFNQGATFAPGHEPIIDVFAGEWDAHGATNELLVVTSTRLTILDAATLSVFETHALEGTALESTPLRETQGLGTAIAILEDRPEGARWLSLWRPNGRSEVGINLGGMGFMGLTSADLNNDGDEEPILAATTTPAFVSFLNLVSANWAIQGPSLLTSVFGSSLYGPYGPDYSGQPSPIATGDMDGDGDIDLVMAVGATEQLVVRFNGFAIQESTLRPEGVVLLGAGYVPGPGTGAVPVGGFLHVPGQSLAGYTHLEVELREVGSTLVLDQATITLSGSSIYGVGLFGNEIEGDVPQMHVYVRPVVRVNGVDQIVGPIATLPVPITLTPDPTVISFGIAPGGVPPIVIPRPGTGGGETPPPPPPTSRALVGPLP